MGEQISEKEKSVSGKTEIAAEINKNKSSLYTK